MKKVTKRYRNVFIVLGFIGVLLVTDFNWLAAIIALLSNLSVEIKGRSYDLP